MCVNPLDFGFLPTSEFVSDGQLEMEMALALVFGNANCKGEDTLIEC